MSIKLSALLESIKDEARTDGTYILLRGEKMLLEPAIGSYSKLWREYCDLVMQGEANLSLAEVCVDQAPFLSDLYIPFQLMANMEGLLSADFINNLIYCHQQVVSEAIVPFDDTRYELLTCLLLADPEVSSDTVTIHIRIQLPYCRCSSRIREALTIALITKLRQNNVLGTLQYQPIGDWPQFLSKEIPSRYLPLYGSVAKQGEPLLKLHSIYPQITINAVGQLVIVGRPISFDSYNPGQHSHIREGKVKMEEVYQQQGGAQEDPYRYIPMFLSVNYWSIVATPINTNMLTPRSAIVDNIPDSPKISDNNNVPVGTKKEKLEAAKRLLRMFSKDRGSRDNIWLEIGKSLHSVFKGSREGLGEWISYSERYIPTKVTACSEIYELAKGSYHNLRTIGYYARLDNPAAYKQWHAEWCLPDFQLAAQDQSHNNVAKALHRCFWLDYCCSSQQHEQWYKFSGHRWRKLDRVDSLRKKISGKFKTMYEILRAELSNQIAKSTDTQFKKMAELTCKSYSTLIGKLGNKSFKDSVISESMEYFKDKSFNGLQNSNVLLTAMEDCIIEIYGDNIIIRDGKPDDYITISTGIYLTNSFHNDHPTVLKLLDWLTKVYPDPKLLRHFLKFSASCLRSGNAEKFFVIFSGVGNNSKTMIVKLFEAALGAHCIKLPKEIITEKRRTSSGPTPELAQAQWAKIAFIDELDEDEILKSGIIKMLTGGDSFFARFLHQDGGKIKSMFKTVVNCNTPPSFAKKEEALTNRVKIFPHLSVWTKKAPSSVEEQFKLGLFPKDEHFEKVIPELAPAFIWLAIQFYPIYSKEGLDDPEIVKTVTDKYWNDNDMYIAFKRDSIVGAIDAKGNRDMTAKLTVIDVYNEFMDWLKTYDKTMGCPSRPKFEKELIIRWGPLQDDYWPGLAFKAKPIGNYTY